MLSWKSCWWNEQENSLPRSASYYYQYTCRLVGRNVEISQFVRRRQIGPADNGRNVQYRVKFLSLARPDGTEEIYYN
jgi:hypothetical protein